MNTPAEEAAQRKPARPLPHPTEVSRPFWDACAKGSLSYQRCERCGIAIFPPQEFCPHDLSTDLRWREASGTGTVYSYTTVWRPQTPAFDVPYVVAVVELDEGPCMVTNIIDCPHDKVTIGMPVEVAFREEEDGFWLPFFRPAGKEAG
jgi:uncharacterized OB-fold protein